MADLLESLGQGLRMGGGILSPQVYQEQARERQNAIVNLSNALKVNQLQQKMAADQKFSEISKGLNLGGMATSGEQLDAFMKAVPLDILGRSDVAQQGLSVIMARQKQEEMQQAKMLQLKAQQDKIEEMRRYHESMASNAELSAVERARHNLELEKIKSAQTQSSIPPDTLNWMARQAWTGDMSVLQGLGYSQQGANNRIALRNEIQKVGVQMGKTPEELAAKNAEFFGTKAGQRTLGTRSANIEMAVSEAQQMAPLALDASSKVSRTEYPTLNALLLAAEKGTGGENVTRLGIATNSLINIYARAINPQGVATVSDKDHARELLAAAWSNGQYAAGIDQLMKELEAARRSPGIVREGFRSTITGVGDKSSGEWTVEKVN